MHWRGTAARWTRGGVRRRGHRGLRRTDGRVEDVVAAGVDPEQLVLDPGLGFAKSAEHNWALLAGLDRLVGLGLPVLVGASRKTFLGRLLAGPDGTVRPGRGADAATLATTVLAAQAGAWGVRVHDAAASVDAVRKVEAVRAGAGERPWLTVPDRIACAGSAPTAITGSTTSSGARADVRRRRRPGARHRARPRRATTSTGRSTTPSWPSSCYAVLTGEPVNLLETLAQRLADVCLADPLVDAVEITVHKPQGRARRAVRRHHGHDPPGRG